MKILYITQYYPPEIGAGSFRAEAIVDGLARRGHEVTVITEIPNYPHGKVYTGFNKRPWQVRKYSNHQVHYVWVKSAVKMNFIKRIALYLSFAFMAIGKGLLLKEKHDVIYVTSPPLFVGITAYVLGKILRIPYIFEVRDLWPQIAIESGELSNPIAIKMARWLESFLYLHSRHIVTVTKGFKRSINQMNVPSSKVDVVFNFAKTDQNITTAIPDNVKSNFNNRFTVLYAGILGYFQGIDVIIQAANLVKHQPDILFIIVGKGTEEQALKKLSTELQLKNIVWLPPQPNTLTHVLLSTAGCSVIPLKNLPSLRMTIPSKLFDYMGCGCPIILSASGEAVDMLRSSGAGVCVEPENADQLANAILNLYNNKNTCNEYSQKGKKAVNSIFSSEKAIDTINNIVTRVVIGS
ncbi:MAG TPA: glycosyltransferase family 4 protein [bacterium]